MKFVFWLKHNRYYFHILIVAVVITLLIPNEGKFKYEYTRGMPWLYETLIAPVDIPILKSETELKIERNAKASEIIPYYRYLDRVKTEQISALMQLVDSSTNSSVINCLRSSFEKIYDKGLINEFIDTNILNKVIIIQKEHANYETPAPEIFTRKTALAFIKRNILEEFPGELYVNAISETKVEQLLVPNLMLDNATTQLAHKSAINYISPTKGILYTGQQIVSKGETVTADIEQLLDSYKAEYEASMGYSGNIVLLKLGHFMVVMAIMFLFVILVYFLKREILDETKKLDFMLLQMTIIVAVTVIVKRINPGYLYLVPYSVIALYITSFFTSKIVIPVYIVSLLPVIIIANGGYEIFFMNAMAGSVVVFCFSYWNRGLMQFMNSLAAFLVISLIYLSFRLIEYGSFTDIDTKYFLYFLWNSVLIVAAYPLIFIFEKIYSLVSNSRLRDLSDTTSPLLQELSDKAPGTFQHSLQVATLSESAAREIGAYALLARVGALYHDVGKMTNPFLFIENQKNGDVNQHDSLTSLQSAKLIIQHVDDGAEIAKKANLPQVIVDFILSHHGHCKTTYFYNQFVNNGGDPAMVDEFRYNGNLPRFKEQVIVMLADAVEAAARTLKDYSDKSISDLVEKMVDARISDNQLIDAEISVREISIIKEVFKQKLSQVYHSRIAYPILKSKVDSGVS